MSLADLKKRVSVIDAWKRLGFPGEPKPNSVVACPWRDSSRKCISISKDGLLFHDFVTDMGGSSIDLLIQACGMDRDEAIDKVYEMAGGREEVDGAELWRRPNTSTPKPQQKPSCSYPKIPSTDDKIRQLCRTRGFRREAVELAIRLGTLAFSEDGWILIGYEGLVAQRRRLDGSLYDGGLKSLTISKSVARWPVGIPCSADRIIFCEGGPDYIAGLQIGMVYNALAVAMLGSMRIHDAAVPLFKGKDVAFVPHQDGEQDTGHRACRKWLSQLSGMAQCRVVKLPCKDLNDYINLPSTKQTLEFFRNQEK